MRKGERKGPYGLEQPVFIPDLIFSICYPSHYAFTALPVRSMGGVRHAQGATLMATVRKPLWLGATPPYGHGS